MINSNGKSTWSNRMPTDTDTIWKREQDPCPEGWRVPTISEFKILEASPAKWIVNYNETHVSGELFGNAPNTLFFPVTGQRLGWPGKTVTNGTLKFEDKGFYWSINKSDINIVVKPNFLIFSFSKTEKPYINLSMPVIANAIRCVAE